MRSRAGQTLSNRALLLERVWPGAMMVGTVSFYVQLLVEKIECRYYFKEAKEAVVGEI